MEFGLYDGGDELMVISASNEDEAWRKIKKVGLRNAQKLFDLVRL